jgi:hypothetical protein
MLAESKDPMDVFPILAVEVVTWARAQMAFTLAFHIILVPLGVSWAAMALIANYRGIKHDDKERDQYDAPVRDVVAMATGTPARPRQRMLPKAVGLVSMSGTSTRANGALTPDMVSGFRVD